MAPSRRTSNGRSPLVNQQSQITAFFGKKSESSSSPSPSPSPVLSKQNPNPSADRSSSPITPSPFHPKRQKPVLLIGSNVVSSSPESRSCNEKMYGVEVVDRRIKVYWPLDKSWYEGCVKSFDKLSGKHLVQYDDGEEEMINLSQEKIEWIEEPEKKKFRRLRRFSMVEDEEEEDLKELEDDSDDEDWEAKEENEKAEDELDLEDVDLEVEEEEATSGGVKKKVNSRKRKVSEGEQMVSNASKSSRVGVLKSSASKVSGAGNAEKLIEPAKRISAESK